MAHANLERSPDQLIEQLNHQRSLKLALAVALLALALVVGFISVYIAYATM
jgi:hypothetical protein